MNENKKYFCQPDIPTSITCWSFTWMIFLTSMLLWLEITVFQIWTLIILILFILVAFIQIRGRYLTISEDEINYHALILYNNIVIKKSAIKTISTNKWGLIKIETASNVYEFLTLPKIANKLTTALSK
ncbi:EbsA family protein [Ligilactobacillus cholophilus]|uniref:EbsA family protein n=1 Tax=Ligilactobacillus cholophilus TaxID=3050131 RepID=UPI0025B20284|nr:EbsA family protein [Ligilactobacillus cholophilus]